MHKEIKEIRQVLKDYSKLKGDLEQTNLLPSPTLNGTGVHSNANHMETFFVRHADISNRMYRVEWAIDSIKDSKYRFIINKYILDKKYNREEMCQRYNISLRGFNNMKNRALVEFAKNYGLDSALDAMKSPQVYEWSTMSVLFQFKEPDIDEKATIINVRNFFTDDVPRLEEMAGQSLNAMLSSPKLDKVGTPGTHLNSTEDLMISSVEAKRELRIIALVISQCTDSSREILTWRYLKHLSLVQIYELHYMTHNTVWTHTNKACLEFANRYSHTGAGHDLRIYIEE